MTLITSYNGPSARNGARLGPSTLARLRKEHNIPAPKRTKTGEGVLYLLCVIGACLVVILAQWVAK